ncbi:MAG TPA: hypothetical protein VFS39_01170 [Nitrospira sp.]|nr:hypothetical protein [Nitrospira sp.]
MHADTYGFRNTSLVAVMLLCLLCGSMGVLWAIDRERPPSSRAVELQYLPKGKYLKIAVLGYRHVVADLLWLKVLQYIGVRDQSAEGYQWAYYAGDVLTDLDPHFVVAYQGLGTVLAIAANQSEESIHLLKKGMDHNPDVWNLPFLLGYNYYFEQHDPATAATYFHRAATLPGAPEYVSQLAAKMMIEAGAHEAALEFLQRLYDQVEDEGVREGLALRIRGAIVERDTALLEAVVKRYKERTGRQPETMVDLVKAGFLSRLPDEPFGGEYRINPSTGAVTSTKMQDRFRLFKNCGGIAGHC